MNRLAELIASVEQHSRARSSFSMLLLAEKSCHRELRTVRAVSDVLTSHLCELLPCQFNDSLKPSTATASATAAFRGYLLLLPVSCLMCRI